MNFFWSQILTLYLASEAGKKKKKNVALSNYPCLNYEVFLIYELKFKICLEKFNVESFFGMYVS